MWSSDSDSEEEARRPREYKIRINFDYQTDFEFKERFRVSRVAAEDIILNIGHMLQHPTDRSYSLEPREQLCVALHWLGNGGQYHGIADMHGIAKSTVCRCVHAMVSAVNTVMFQNIVKWPENRERVIEQFHQIGGMPHVVGVVDGTLINIDAPHEHEEQYVDRHGRHSINCMVVCGPDRKFYFVSARWPGSVHDARVLRNSALMHRMEQGWRPYPRAVILADSAYPLKEWLIPPMLRRLDEGIVQRFNRAHKRTRTLVEQSIGILKEKFPSLNYLRVEPEFACNIFKCCTVICNIEGQEDNEINADVLFDVDDSSVSKSNVSDIFNAETNGECFPPIISRTLLSISFNLASFPPPVPVFLALSTFC